VLIFAISDVCCISLAFYILDAFIFSYIPSISGHFGFLMHSMEFLGTPSCVALHEVSRLSRSQDTNRDRQISLLYIHRFLSVNT
jgi:hypothetical protein